MQTMRTQFDIYAAEWNTLPAQRSGQPGLRCVTRLNVSETPKVILTFSGGT